MSNIIAPAYENLTIGYHETETFSIIQQIYALLNRYF